MTKKNFSIIELMTVLLVVLLLISLLTPIMTNLKMNAKTVVCRSQLRQQGILINYYISDSNGYLPNDTATPYALSNGVIVPADIPMPGGGKNNQFYSNWNGHLLPYMDVHLKDRYSRYAMVTKMGCTRWAASQLGSGKLNPPPPDLLSNGFIVVDEALKSGGYDDLKVFICPEVHLRTFDVAAALKFNDVRVPRIQQLCTGGVTSFGAFSDTAGYDYGMAGGIPTSYLANERFFGKDNAYSNVNINSLRVDQISDISRKIFIVEGGIADAFGTGSNGSIGAPYYSAGSPSNDGGDLSGSRLHNIPQFHKLNFVHDDIKDFWIMQGTYGYSIWPNMWWGRDKRLMALEKFNAKFLSKAYMVEDDIHTSSYHSCTLVSYVNPTEWSLIFRNFFDKEVPGVVAFNPFTPYVGEPNDFHYLVGKMNVLMGDGSVATKDQSELFNKRRETSFE